MNSLITCKSSILTLKETIIITQLREIHCHKHGHQYGESQGYDLWWTIYGRSTSGRFISGRFTSQQFTSGQFTSGRFTSGHLNCTLTEGINISKVKNECSSVVLALYLSQGSEICIRDLDGFFQDEPLHNLITGGGCEGARVVIVVKGRGEETVVGEISDSNWRRGISLNGWNAYSYTQTPLMGMSTPCANTPMTVANLCYYILITMS